MASAIIHSRGASIRLEIVNANLFSLVHVPAGLSKERRHVALCALCLAVEYRLSTCGGRSSKLPSGGFGGRHRQLIKLKRGQFRRHHVLFAHACSRTGPRRNWVLYRVVQTRIEESSLPLQFKVSDVSVPVSDAAPAATPRVQIDSRHVRTPAASAPPRSCRQDETPCHRDSVPRRTFPAPNWQALSLPSLHRHPEDQ